MKIGTLILFIPTMLIAQTEFYLYSNTLPPGCPAQKVTLPIECSLGSEIGIKGIVWNPDSLDWCTKEGYYRSLDFAHLPHWEIDTIATDMGHEFGITIPVLDTLEHLLTATYLDFPPVSIKFKAANDKFPRLNYSGKQKLFSSDSIHLFMVSMLPVVYSDSTSIRTFRDDSARINTTILTYDVPSDTSIKLTAFLCHNNRQTNGDFRATYSPTLNSYSIKKPLNKVLYLAKKATVAYGIIDTSYDTILAVFKKQSTYDTAKTIFITLTYLGYTDVDNKFVTRKQVRCRNSNSAERVFDLRGRLVSKSTGNNADVNSLSNSIYLLKTDDDKTAVYRTGAHNERNK